MIHYDKLIYELSLVLKMMTILTTVVRSIVILDRMWNSSALTQAQDNWKLFTTGGNFFY